MDKETLYQLNQRFRDYLAPSGKIAKFDCTIETFENEVLARNTEFFGCERFELNGDWTSLRMNLPTAMYILSIINQPAMIYEYSHESGKGGTYYRFNDDGILFECAVYGELLRIAELKVDIMKNDYVVILLTDKPGESPC